MRKSIPRSVLVAANEEIHRCIPYRGILEEQVALVRFVLTAVENHWAWLALHEERDLLTMAGEDAQPPSDLPLARPIDVSRFFCSDAAPHLDVERFATKLAQDHVALRQLEEVARNRFAETSAKAKAEALELVTRLLRLMREVSAP